MSGARVNSSPGRSPESCRLFVSGVLALALSLLFVPQPALGLNLYDIVQLTKAGYADLQIIELVRATGSRFALDATSVARLKQAGVSEDVIEALIEARAPDPQEAWSEGPLEPGLPEADRAHLHPPADVGGPLEAVPKPTEPRGPRPAALPGGAGEGAKTFSSFPFEETGSGHSASHQHYILTVNEVPVLVLRSEAGFPRIADRVEQAVRRLNQLARSPEGHFFVPQSDASVWYRDTASDSVRILEVSRGDVIAYQQRSLGNVSATRLAAYWAALLNDYTQLFVFGRPPTELVGLHLGETLGRIHAELTASAEKAPASEILATRLRGILDHLSADEKEHLIELRERIPAEFEMR